MNKKNFIKVLAAGFLLAYLCVTCNDVSESSGGTPYDPSKPLTVSGFYPDSGGFATRVIIEGSNFGNNPEEVRVWFNDKQAAVIGTNGDHLYAIAPRTPGDTCTISVAVGNDSTSIGKPFIYRVSTTVVTIAGHQGVYRFEAGTLATTTFGRPRYLCVDDEGNLYGANWDYPNCTYLLSEERDVVMQLPMMGSELRAGVPAIDPTGKIILFPEDPGDAYVSYDRDLQWAGRKRLIIHPSTEEIAAGKKDFPVITWKKSFATCEADGMVYTYDWMGYLVKFDPVTRKGELVESFADIVGTGHALLFFHPVEKELLFLGFEKAAMYTYNTLTGEFKHLTGTLGVSGYRDGPFEDALFSGEFGQCVFDENLDIIFPNANNHCIRKLNMKERIVTTLIGKGGVAGYQDGNPDDALFNYPYGMCIDKDGTIYIGDSSNNCVRKLVIQ